MFHITFPLPNEITDEALKFAVIVAKYQNQWIFCRHKERTTWEIPGGHREPGETIEEAARRELWEETGAVAYTLRQVGVYGVQKDYAPTYGMLYMAEVTALAPLPEASEIGEIALFDRLPQQLTYPGIQPKLYTQVQGWLNLQSAADELWDVYDADRKRTGRLHRRGDPMEQGDYHLVVHVWVRNRNRQFLLTQRAPSKGFPLMWEATGGSAVAGDDSLTAALREMREETGLVLQPENGRVIMTRVGDHYIADIWLFEQDFDLKDAVLQPSETCSIRWASEDELLALDQAGDFVPYSYLQELLAAMNGE